MHRRRAAIVVSALALATVTSGCGGDDPDHLAAGDDFSVEAALAELPVPDVDEDQLYTVTIADLDAATEINGAERPDDTDQQAVAQWLLPAQGTVAPEGEDFAPIFVPPIETAGGSRAVQAAEFEDELGWSVVDVAAAAEVVVPPFRFGVVAGELDEATLEDADLEALEDGVFSAGEGEDGETHPDATTVARPIGAPLRLAADDGRLATSSSTEAVQDWASGEAATLAEDDALRAIAAALDDADAVSALLAVGIQGPEGNRPPGRDQPPLIGEDFTAVGIGWGVEDGAPAITVAYAFADEATAEDAVDQVEAVYAEGVSLQTAEPISEKVTVGDVEADGSVVVAHLTLPEGNRPQVLADMLIIGDAPFTHP
jgi:hypothetical protein